MPKWPDQVRPLTAATLSVATTGSHLVGIHCWASWNAHDFRFAEGMEPLLREFADRLEIYQMDVEANENSQLAGEWDIRNVPALVVFQDGKHLQTFWQQNESINELLDRIRNWLRIMSRPKD